MRTLEIPENESGWKEIGSRILRANLKLNGMNYIDLQQALAEMGVDETQKSISSKLSRGTFSVAFFLQVLAACQVEQLALPQHNPVSKPKTLKQD